MRINLIICFALALIGFSCRKSNNAPPITTHLQDTLMSWKTIGSIPGKFLGDIWFTSPAKGFIVGDKLYQTTDGGISWTEIPNTSGIDNFYNLFFVNQQIGFAQGAAQIATTVDGGNTWTLKGLPTDSGLTVFFANPSVGFYGDEGGGGLEKTSDAGTSWSTIFSDPGTPRGYYPYFLNADTGFVATGSGTFASTADGGQTWPVRTRNLPANPVPESYNQLFFLNEDTGFYSCPAGILKTVDGGSSWQTVLQNSVDPLNLRNVNVVRFVDANTGYYKGSSVIYKTSDGGNTWTLNCKLGPDHFIGMYFIDPHLGWACTDQGRIFSIQL
jgi:photosystem II stability/assembly factor-like uncharacterized protein